MKYASVLTTIVLIWIAIILMVLARSNTSEAFGLYVTGVIATLILFFIGFARQ